MPAGLEDQIVCTGAGLFVETATGRRVYVTFAYTQTDDGGMVMQMTRGDGVAAEPWPLSAPQAQMVSAFFFPKDPSDGKPVVPVRDPVNIDGTKRNALRDRLNRVDALSNVAACWLMLVLTTVGLHS